MRFSSSRASFVFIREAKSGSALVVDSILDALEINQSADKAIKTDRVEEMVVSEIIGFK